MLLRTRSLITALALSATALTFSSPVRAQGAAQTKAAPPKPACGITALPFVQGAELVYTAVDPPNKPQSGAPPAKPRQPAKVTIKVASVKPDPQLATQTQITLEESADDLKYTTTLVCTKDALTVPPESFFFSGEPGGGLLLTLGAIQRTGTSYQFNLGRLRVPEWIENIKAPFTRGSYEGTGVTLASGTLDMQRIVIAGFTTLEAVTTALGTFSAIPVMVDLRGSVSLDFKPEAKTFNIPANTISKMWIAENVGLVQVYNTNGHMYQLSEVKTP